MVQTVVKCLIYDVIDMKYPIDLLVYLNFSVVWVPYLAVVFRDRLVRLLVLLLGERVVLPLIEVVAAPPQGVVHGLDPVRVLVTAQVVIHLLQSRLALMDRNRLFELIVNW